MKKGRSIDGSAWNVLSAIIFYVTALSLKLRNSNAAPSTMKRTELSCSGTAFVLATQPLRLSLGYSITIKVK